MENFVSEIVRDNIRVTLETDDCVENPFEYFYWTGFHFDPNDRRRADNGDESLPGELQGWHDDRENMVADVDSYHDDVAAASTALDDHYLQPDHLRREEDESELISCLADAVDRLADATAELQDHLENRPNYLQWWERGFTVTADPGQVLEYSHGEHAPTDATERATLAKVIVSGNLETYIQWGEGDVFYMRAWHLDPETEEWEELPESGVGGCFFTDWLDDDEVWNHAEWYFSMTAYVDSLPVQEKLF